MPILYGSPLSPFVRKVAVALEEKGIAYEWKQVRPHDRLEEFKAISPLGKIPAYKDERIALADSSVICFYLEKTHPHPALYPADTPELVRALWFEEYFDGALFEPMSMIYFHSFLYPKMLDKPADGDALKAAREKLPPMLNYLESELKPNQWIVGSQFSIADISLALGFSNLHYTDFKIDKTKYPRLDAYVERIASRPSFKKCADAVEAFLTQMRAKKIAAAKAPK